MGIFRTSALAAAAAITFANTASASSVLVAARATQTEAGQDFDLMFERLPVSDGTGGSLRLYARGDFEEFTDTVDEFLTLDVEGELTTGPIGGFDMNNEGVGFGGPFDFFNRMSDPNEVSFQRTFALDGSVLDTLLADNQVNVLIDLSDGADMFTASSGVSVVLSYESALAIVPLPATLPLLLAGLGGFGLMRRRALR